MLIILHPRIMLEWKASWWTKDQIYKSSFTKFCIKGTHHKNRHGHMQRYKKSKHKEELQKEKRREKTKNVWSRRYGSHNFTDRLFLIDLYSFSSISTFIHWFFRIQQLYWIYLWLLREVLTGFIKIFLVLSAKVSDNWEPFWIVDLTVVYGKIVDYIYWIYWNTICNFFSPEIMLKYWNILTGLI